MITVQNQRAPDQKVVDKVRKLLALAADGGATEHEAALAAERARSIMAEAGLTTASVEAAGGQGESRLDDRSEGDAFEKWQPPLMQTIAATCFVHCEVMYQNWSSSSQGRRSGYRLIGRESAVVTARALFEYLCQTIRRSVREHPDLEKPRYFMRGMSERLRERIRDRHDEAMREQAAEARERNEAAATRGGSSSTALVVVLEDYAQKEQDLNDDLRRGVPPGTTARERAERLVDEEKRRKRRLEEIARIVEELGVSEEVANYMAAGFSRERAEELCAPDEEEPARVETEAQKHKRERRERARRDRMHARWDKDARKQNSSDWQAGARAGDSVGLDTQVGAGRRAKALK